jgi:hypothetical protein
MVCNYFNEEINCADHQGRSILYRGTCPYVSRVIHNVNHSDSLVLNITSVHKTRSLLRLIIDIPVIYYSSHSAELLVGDLYNKVFSDRNVLKGGMYVNCFRWQ